MSRIFRNFLVTLVACLALSACKSELFSDLSEREANQVVAALMGAGIPASKAASRGDGVTVMVEENRFAEAIELLNARGLPSEKYDSFGDVFQKDGLVSSPIEERARYIYALSQELSHTIAEVDGVLSARIHVVLPETDMLGRDFKPSSASVFIRHIEDSLRPNFTAQIRLLVANSIEGLVYDNVTVVTVPTAVQDSTTSQGPILESVFGIWVHPNSIMRLWSVLGGLAGVAALALALVGAQAFRSRRASRLDEEFDVV